jgi:hypothetical protein
MAPIRSATVSAPVDAYVVVLVPSLTVIAPSAGIPRVNSEVLAMSGTVPVPVAGEPEEPEEPEELEELEELELEEEDAFESLDDDAVELPALPEIALCSAAESAVLTRFKAVWLARLARPWASLDTALPI